MDRPDIDAIRDAANRTAPLTVNVLGPAHTDALHLLALCDYIEQLEAEQPELEQVGWYRALTSRDTYGVFIFMDSPAETDGCEPVYRKVNP